MSEVILRAMSEQDLALLTDAEGGFNDWGPRQPVRPLPDTHLDHPEGGLTIVADGEVAGEVSWRYVQWGPGTASRNPEIGIWLSSAHRGRGIGTAAQRQLAALFVAHTAVTRVQASTDVENIAEQRALERAGFSREGIIRASQWRAGGYHDMCIYAVLRADQAA